MNGANVSFLFVVIRKRYGDELRDMQYDEMGRRETTVENLEK